ncbi:MAG: hypothetical protein ACM32H_07615, partial [Candidatus Aminicenantes bacterium RBG_16_66_30]
MSDTKKRFAPNMPEGTGLLAYLGKGEKSPIASHEGGTKDTWELRVEDGRLAVPAGLEKKLGLPPGSRLEVVLNNGR